MNCASTETGAFHCDACLRRLSDDVCACPARSFFDLFGDKWTLPVLGCLVNGPMRFSQFRKTLEPISERMLILTLKKLEDTGFLTRGPTDDHANQHTYRLTALGRSLLEHVGELFLWMNANAPQMLKSFAARRPPGRLRPNPPSARRART